MSFGGSTAQHTVLVTGAAGGMAQGINERVSLAGWRIVCADLSLQAAEEAAKRVHIVGGDAVAVELDVTSDSSIRAASTVLSERSIEIHAVVNAAGVMERRGIEDLDPASFERVLAINLTGPYRVIREFAPAMVARAFGRIINISSLAARNGYPFPAYTASKAGLSNLSRSLLNDFWGTGVTVNNICPGPVETAMLSAEVREDISQRLPTGQAVSPDEIGAAVAFLLSDDARSITGADLVVDGGASAYFQLSDRR